MKNIIITFLMTLCYFLPVNAQNVYKTPSGDRYHLSNCRMVENVSEKILINKDSDSYNLTPCKFCTPPKISKLINGNKAKNKSVGESKSVRCIGNTARGSRCLHKTRLANHYCYQHTSQNSGSRTSNKMNSSSTSSAKCGARTKSGKYCRRKVKGGGRCYQHK